MPVTMSILDYGFQRFSNAGEKAMELNKEFVEKLLQERGVKYDAAAVDRAFFVLDQEQRGGQLLFATIGHFAVEFEEEMRKRSEFKARSEATEANATSAAKDALLRAVKVAWNKLSFDEKYKRLIAERGALYMSDRIRESWRTA